MTRIDRWKAVLRDRRGISLSVPETVVSISVRIAVYAGMAGAIAGLLAFMLTTNTSTATSSGYQNAGTRFAKDVAAADIVRGDVTQAVSLLTGIDDRCQVTTWRSVDLSPGGRTLVAEVAVLAEPCTPSTPMPAPTATGRIAYVAGITTPEFSYENVVARVLTFDAAGNPTAAAGPTPAGAASQDWEDLRPQRVKMKLTSERENLTRTSRHATLVGTTSVVNYAEAAPNLPYIPPTEPLEPAAPVVGLNVARSSTTGALYGGVREGIQVSFTGGQCEASDATVTIEWTPQTPTGLAAVSTTFRAALTGAAHTRELAGVPNGSTGIVTVSSKCQDHAAPETASTPYTQTVPATTLTATQLGTAERHRLDWTAVSSLPTRFAVTSTSTNGLFTDKLLTTTGDLRYTATQQPGTVYGFTSHYAVTPTVADVTAAPAAASLANTWPAAPAAQNISYTRTGAGGVFTNGTISWQNNSCPAGTELYTQEIQNVRWNSSSAAQETGNWTVGTWGKNKASAAWTPAYAKQGHPYQERVNTKCVSPVTGSESPVTPAQSATFYTGFAALAAPIWDGYDFRDWVRGDTVGYATCRDHGGNMCGTKTDSLVLDYRYFCPAGSWLNASSIRSQSWQGGVFWSQFGDRDGWELADGRNHETVIYGPATYKCQTHWQVSAWAANSGQFNYEVYR